MNKRGLTLKTGLIVAILILLVAIIGVLVYYGVTSSGNDSDSDSDSFDDFGSDDDSGDDSTGGDGGFGSFCGNGICEAGESASSCSADCTSNAGGNNQGSGSFMINLESPGEGDTYGTNSSLDLEFHINDTKNVLDSCWYTINDGSRNIVDCSPGLNSLSFDNPGNGQHELEIAANATDKRIIRDSATFTVHIGAPTIELNSPADNGYSNSQPQQFKYKPIDTNLDRCEIWGDFTGTWKLNQTDNDPENNQENIFSAMLGVGRYTWQIRCTDTENKTGISGNRTLTMDFTQPSLTLRSLTYDQTLQRVKANVTVTDSSPTMCHATYSGNSSGQTSPIPCNGTGVILIDIQQNGQYNVTVHAIDAANNAKQVSGNIVLNLACGFSSAGWSTSVANIGDEVDLLTNGTVATECNGKAVLFKIYKENGNVYLMNKTSTFFGREATTSWTVGSDGSGGGGNGLIIPLLLEAFALFGFIKLNRRGKISNGILSLTFIALAIIFVAVLAIVPDEGRSINLQPAPERYYYIASLVENPSINEQSTFLSTPGCGNDVMEEGEQCDGSDFGGIDTSCYAYNNSYSGGQLDCTSSCTIRHLPPRCDLGVCTDGYLNPGEECDDGDNNNENSCTNECTIPLIETADDLDNIRNNLDGYFRLANDIDLAGIDFEPIGTPNNPFTGTLDGNNKKIKNLEIDAQGGNNAGFFAVSSGEIRNLEFENAQITDGESNAGVVVGKMEGGLIKNVVVSGSGSVEGDVSIGGFVGNMNGGLIEKSSTIASVSARISAGGGFVGRMSGDSSIKESFATGNVASTIGDRIGGFVGNMLNSAKITDSFAHGSASGVDRIGGFAGQIADSSVIRRVYSKGHVSGTGSNIGGLIGGASNNFVVDVSYWDIETSDQETSAAGQGKTTIKMTKVPPGTDIYVGWDWNNVWFHEVDGEYPVLQWA